MYLLQLGIKNIKRNFLNYILYFFSLTFIVVVYFTFLSIYSNSDMLTAMDYMKFIPDMFKLSNFILIFFCIIFIWYCNSFFIKKRGKEFALYSILGVKKRHIGMMIFTETFFIGLGSLGLGIFISSLFLKLFTMLLLKAMKLSTSIPNFSIPANAIINTAKTFLIIFIIASIKNFLSIKKIKLVSLFKSDEVSEKEPKISILISIVSLFLVSKGYSLVMSFEKINFSRNAIIAIIFITLGTYGLFSSFLVLLIKLSKRNKIHYYSGINMFSTSELLYRINKNAKTLATVSILIAGTIIAVASSYSYYYINEKYVPKQQPFSFCYVSNEKSLDDNIKNVIAKYPDHRLNGEVEAKFIRLNGKWPEVNTSLSAENISRFSIMAESDYNKIIKALNIKESKKLNSKNQAIIIDGYYNDNTMKSYIGTKAYIEKTKSFFDVIDFKSQHIINESLISRLLIVRDDVFSQLSKNEKLFRVKGFLVDNSKDSKELNEEINKTFDKIVKEKNLPRPNSKNNIENNLSSFYDDYKDTSKTAGIFSYIGTFLGLVFLICTASIIFFKQLSDAEEDKGNYDILKNIGASPKEIKKSINKQVIFLFIIPLIVGVLHSYIALSIFERIPLVNVNIKLPITVTIIIYTVIYLIYCGITINSYYNIVNGN